LDRLRETEQSFLTYEQTSVIAMNCGLNVKMLPKLLAFLHEMGILMWHSEESLRDVIILDPVAFFVTPATNVICKHQPTDPDGTYHNLEIHKRVRKQNGEDFNEMVKYGCISTELLNALLEDSFPHIGRVAALMLKYGLLVKLSDHSSHDDSLHGDDEQQVISYLAPALLAKNPCVLPDHSWTDVSVHRRLYFVFTTSDKLLNRIDVTWQDCRDFGFLPSGLFERLLCKVVTWSEDTLLGTSILGGRDIYRDEAVVRYGNQRFRVKLLPDVNAVQVDIEGSSPLAIHWRLKETVASLIAECMKSLKFTTLVEYDYSRGGANTRDDQNMLLIPLHHVRSSAKSHSVLSVRGGRKLLDADEVYSKYSYWLNDLRLFENYDVFLSYRWGKLDSMLVHKLFDRLTLHTIGADNRSIVTFLDTYRLQEGKLLQVELLNTLASSSVVVPIVSVEALSRMQSHDPTKIDNLLLEWILMLVCYNHPLSQVKAILPVLLGSRFMGGINDITKEGVIDSLPNISPQATMNMAVQLLSRKEVSMTPSIAALSVQGIVKSLLHFFYICGWAHDGEGQLLRHVSSTVVSCLVEIENSQRRRAESQEGQRRAESQQGHRVVTAVAVSARAIISSDDQESARPLDTLTMVEVQQVLANVSLDIYNQAVIDNRVDGATLSCCSTVEELLELGISRMAHARNLLNYINQWRETGVNMILL